MDINPQTTLTTLEVIGVAFPAGMLGAGLSGLAWSAWERIRRARPAEEAPAEIVLRINDDGSLTYSVGVLGEGAVLASVDPGFAGFDFGRDPVRVRAFTNGDVTLERVGIWNPETGDFAPSGPRFVINNWRAGQLALVKEISS